MPLQGNPSYICFHMLDSKFVVPIWPFGRVKVEPYPIPLSSDLHQLFFCTVTIISVVLFQNHV